MFETDSDFDPDETVSTLALDVIDELRMKMLEWPPGIAHLA
ncbi:hypothetical protein I541_0003 [Mycobacteroides abscessus]|nr:hypothetical protein I541_0003 [Mycobacteroides abscessus]